MGFKSTELYKEWKMKVKISKENWINATTDFKGKFWCPIERQESLLNVWPNSVDIEIEVDKPNTKKVKKYKYTRKSIWWILEDYKEAKNITPSEYARIQQVQKDLLAQKEDRKEHAYFTSPIFHEKTITTPSPLEIEELGIETLVEPFDKFVSQDRINHSFMTKINEIIRNQKKLYQLIKEKL
jgi:hypothetical protein